MTSSGPAASAETGSQPGSQVDGLVKVTRPPSAGPWQSSPSQLADRPHPRAAVAALNSVAATPCLPPALSGSARAWSKPTAAQALSSIARDAIELFGGPAASRLRECSAEDCLLVFVDLSRPGQRRWCSMDRCGNRAKQRARRR
ncbi:CGNR zinc finger domain-containing protein [Allokutzneria sp. A3M-2-11 16]|uniref:CGNR zinc finger domain-containing protein n=1 Tax=Allokutzneria sp. A3M-2-11 16 TaxID=2962043 RepID=UPI0020B6D290|nr:CGNR zinc finger domain-containing protein [Allokutzneria sp. A3M-2-11 16]MCP3802880.1 CGNR zinc finger domain-containing protein [Allokutzneria sp. A3M-2-11 16]